MREDTKSVTVLDSVRISVNTALESWQVVFIAIILFAGNTCERLIALWEMSLSDTISWKPNGIVDIFGFAMWAIFILFQFVAIVGVIKWPKVNPSRNKLKSDSKSASEVKAPELYN